MLLLIDNYDSFAHNLARYLVRLGCDTRVVRNDATDVEQVGRLAPQAIVLSPGPCTPWEAGCCLDLVRQFHRAIPILGICLGHQAIVAALGGKIVRCEPRHAMVSLVRHNQQGVFLGIPTPCRVCRYHSLAAEPGSLPAELMVTGQSEEGVVMAVAHRQYPVVGLQFHPESILTEHGFQLLGNFLRLAGVAVTEPIPSVESELVARAARGPVELPRPVTF